MSFSLFQKFKNRFHVSGNKAMKKTDLSVILICILCGFIFTGCGKLKAIMDPKFQNAGDSHNNAVDDVSLQHKDEIDKTEDIPLTDSEKDDDLDNNKDADPDMSVADKDDTIYGNGGHFVKYGGKIYFRAPGKDAMNKAALWGEYDHIGEAVSSTVTSYNPDTHETQALFEDTSIGPMVISGGRFILTEMDANGESHVNSFSLDGSDKRNLPGSRIYATQLSGKYFVTGGYEDDNNLHFYICDDGGSSHEVDNTLTLHDFAGISDDHFFCITCEGDEPYGSFAGYELETGNEIPYGHFGEISEYYNYPGLPECLDTDENSVYLQMSAYEGTGNFYSSSKWYKADLSKAGSLEEITVEGERTDDEEEGYTRPTVMLNDGKLKYVDGTPQTAAVDSEGYAGIYDENGKFIKIADGYVTLYDDDQEGRTNTEICELVDDCIYIVRNNEVYDPDSSIGWRDAYRRQNTWIECINVDSGEIVNLLSIGVSNMNEIDTDKTLEFGDQSDPLKGLVADDILEMYRASYDVNNSNSVHDEAYALGSWIQDTIGNNINSDIRELGESIGRKYEFRFGTDISNNFDDNFPEIYGTYFALKDYYNSDGKNSSEIYDDISEENDLLGTGDPERIKEMYNDMQLFITSCNTYIRGR